MGLQFILLSLLDFPVPLGRFMYLNDANIQKQVSFSMVHCFENVELPAYYPCEEE